MEEAINENDKEWSQPNVELNADDHNASMITTINEEAALLGVNGENGPAESEYSGESTSQNYGGPSNVVEELKSHDDQVFKCCPDRFCNAVGKHLAHNERLLERETELRKRLATLEFWIPALTLIKILTGEVDSSNVKHRINEQTLSASTSNAHLHASLSQHNDSRVRDIEAQRKEAHRRFEVAHKLLLEKQSAIDERAKKIKEAERKHRSLEQKIAQLEEQLECDGVDLMKVTSRESVISFGPDHLARILKLEELVAAEEHIKRQLKDLECTEQRDVNTFKPTERIMPRDKTHTEIDKLRSQLQVELAANQGMVGRIVFLEDQVEYLEDKLAHCNDYVEGLTARDTIQSSLATGGVKGRREIKKKLVDKAIITAPDTVTVATGSDHDTVKRKNRGVFATVRSNSKETLTRVELTDRSVQEPMAENRRQNRNQLLRSYNDDDIDNRIVPIEPLNAGDESRFLDSSNQIAHDPPTLPPMDESHVDTSFKSLPSQIHGSDWSTFSDINKSVEPPEINQRSRQDGVSFVSLQSTIASDNGEAAVRPIQTGGDEYDEANISVGATVEPPRPNSPRYVSLKSAVDESAWSTFSNIHGSGSSVEDNRPALQQGGPFVPLASTLHDTSVDQIEDIALRRPLIRTVTDPNSERQDQAIREMQTDRIELPREILEMWLHNINDIRRHISRCPICISKKRTLIFMCKAICHYLGIQFNVCTDNNENDTAPIAAREGEVYTIQDGVLRQMIRSAQKYKEIPSLDGSIGAPIGMSTGIHDGDIRSLPPRKKRDEQLLTNESESTHSPRRDLEIRSAQKYREIPSLDGSIGEPIGMSTGIRDDDVRSSSAKRIDRGQRSLPQQQTDSLPHDRVIDRSTDTTTFTGGKHSGQYSNVAVDSMLYDRSNDSVVDRAHSNDFQMIDSTHYAEPPSMDKITGLPIGTSTPKRKIPTDELRQTKSPEKSKDREEEAQTLDDTSYMTVRTHDQAKWAHEEMRGHSNGRKKHMGMTLTSVINRKSGNQRSKESGTPHKITQQAPSLQHTLSDSESQRDSKSEDDETKKVWRMEEAPGRVRREKNRKIRKKVRKEGKEGQVYGKSLRNKEIISHIDRPSISRQSPSDVQPITEGSCCICDITCQFPNIIQNDYKRSPALLDNSRPRDCLAGNSAPIRHEKINIKHHKRTRSHRKNEKKLETPSNVQHRDVSREHLPDFNCGVCDCEPCGTLSTVHSTSGETRNNPSRNVPSGRRKKNQGISAKIARTNG